ncbi:MAG: hypothetical protein Q4A81_04595 [Pasteurellaceae bacterium]|nr:hypothetical protein [Pasteurellaceae bacterium]
MAIELLEDEYNVLLTGKAHKVREGSKGYVHYRLGQHKQNHHIAIALWDNDENGLFSKEWILLEKLNQLLSSKAKGVFTSSLLREPFKSKSRNNQAFLMAVLLSDEIGLVRKSIGYHYQYELTDNYRERVVYLQSLGGSIYFG